MNVLIVQSLRGFQKEKIHIYVPNNITTFTTLILVLSTALKHFLFYNFVVYFLLG